jgi:protein PhnA
LAAVQVDAEITMSGLPKCPKCGSEYTYEDGNMYVCPECAHEWSQAAAAEAVEERPVVRDAYGNVLADGDSVTVIKDLKVKGSSSVVKVGTKVKNIRLVEGDHNIDCRIDGIGPMALKSEFVKKA